LKEIEEVIVDEHRKQNAVAEIILPAVFDIDNMSVKDIQIIVYGRIIEELEDKGFKPKIKFKDENTTSLIVKWAIKIDEKTKSKYKQIIDKHRL
jgi:hypothetical protein